MHIMSRRDRSAAAAHETIGLLRSVRTLAVQQTPVRDYLRNICRRLLNKPRRQRRIDRLVRAPARRSGEMSSASRRAERRCTTARVMRVVPTDRTIVAARIVAMVHGGKCAGVAAGGGSGGTGVKEGAGGEGAARTAGAGPMAAVRHTISPPSLASILGTRGGFDGAG
jgi:hypothetical protein